MSKQTELQNDFARKTVEWFKNHDYGYADLSIRFGKTRYAIEVLRGLFKFDCTVLLCYPDNLLKKSWESELIRWNYNNPNITFVNFSSLWKYKDKIFDFIICDEFHSASALERDYCHQIMTNEFNTKFLGLSGTVSPETKAEWGLTEIVKYSTDQAITDGVVADYRVTVHLVSLDNKIKTPNKKGKLLTEKQRYDNYSYVIKQMQKDGRNSMHLALSRNRLSLSSIGKIEYTKKFLVEKMQQKRTIVFTGLADVADKLGFSYHSKSKDDSNYQAFMNKEITWLALAAMGKMGITYPLLDSVILMNFTYNKEETQQILQRAIKLDYVNKIADLHIICLNEEPELKKVKESLSMLDKTKIKYV